MDERNKGSGATNESYMGAGDNAPDANTNLDPSLPGGPATQADRNATQAVEDRYAGSGQSGALPADGQSDPARQMDNSGMLSPGGEGHEADIIGASGDDRNENR
ncbi:hypothetical protein DAETH_30910 [Deinococcus aetherius]|uniref:Uncharacterized protein n=1 Tax=Deinococcus aetherius TaxID=200252 RepID=A0ABN6RID4_9DEIO|nr:hypothetical protein [Deinococcus aetherius]BDP43122.1 hypothetical protein DAETH_30910 [Deinococcus aetherius]